MLFLILIAFWLIVASSLPSASASGTLFGVTACCPNQFVHINPSTGEQIPLSTVADESYFYTGFPAFDPNTHRMFFFRERASDMEYHLITIDTKIGDVVEGPTMSPLAYLGFDPNTNTLFGVTVCCPNQFVHINPSTGEQTPLSTVGDESYFFSGFPAFDPNTHRMFLLRARASDMEYHLITIDTKTGDVVEGPTTSFIDYLGFDPSYSDVITLIPVKWQDEIDEMVIPYDKVDLNFTFKNNLQNSLNNVNLIFNSNSDLISLENQNINIGSVAPGDEFSVINSISVAGVKNSQIMDEIIDINGSGQLSLIKSINVELKYNSESIEFVDITPNDENNNPLTIQYPNFYTDLDFIYEDEDINYYLQGDDDLSHGDTNNLVRKYALRAATYPDGIFPDDPAIVSFNVFRYVDVKLDYDSDPGISYNDLWIVDKIENGDITNYKPWICIPQAYLFTSFERTLGFSSREITVGEGVAKIGPIIGYIQNAAAEI